MTDTTRDLIQQLAGLAKRKHYTCEDSWYNCPQSEDGSANDNAGEECDCGADEHNAKVDAICAALAQPEPEEPTGEELEEFALKHGGGYFNCDCQAEADILTRKHVSNYRAVLARWGRPAIQPIPVSERPWEREGWCDNNGWCWGFDADDTDPFWESDHPEACGCWTHVLPHYALPIPEPTTQEDN